MPRQEISFTPRLLTTPEEVPLSRIFRALRQKPPCQLRTEIQWVTGASGNQSTPPTEERQHEPIPRL